MYEKISIFDQELNNSYNRKNEPESTRIVLIMTVTNEIDKITNYEIIDSNNQYILSINK